MNRNVRKLILVLHFLLLFNLFSLPLYLVIYFKLQIYALRKLNAILLTNFLKLIGMPTQNFDSTVSVDGFKVNVSWDSTAWKSMFALAALILSTPVASRKKPIAIFFGVAMVFLVNLLRLITTVIAMVRFDRAYFNFLHLFLWREGMVTFVIAAWLFWLLRNKNNIDEKQNIFRWLVAEREE